MTREQIVALFPDATPEQITGILNQNNSEVAAEKAKVNQYKDKAKKADELQTKADELQTRLDDLESKGLTDGEKVIKQLETANAEIAQLKQEKMIADMRNNAASKFKVTAEEASKIVKDDGTFDYDVLGKIIADKETAAAQAKEKEIADGSTNPGGGTAGAGASGKNKDKPDDVANAESIVFGTAAPTPEARDYYKI